MKRAILMVLFVVLAGCSPGATDQIASAGGATSQSAKPVSDEEKAREFTECMRDNGIDLPDPVPDGDGGFDFGAADAGVDLADPAFRTAVRECRDKLPGGGQEYLDDPAVQAQLREFAQCMRDNGLADFPDPEPGGGFGGALAELDRDSPAFQQAMDACQDTLPDRVGR